MPKSKLPDIDHTGEPIDGPQAQAMVRHKPEYSSMCPMCKPRIERNRHIAALFKSLREFGYSTVTHEEVAAAYDGALAGEDDGADIIRKLVRSQMIEAGLVKEV